MSTESEGVYVNNGAYWSCNHCSETIDADHYNDRDAHVWAHYDEEKKVKFEWKDKYVRATLGGSVIEGRVLFESASGIDIAIMAINDVDDFHLTALYDAGWTITEIPKPVILPTKRDALVRINGETWYRGSWTDSEPWVSESSETDDQSLKEEAERWGDMVVIFEGTDE